MKKTALAAIVLTLSAIAGAKSRDGIWQATFDFGGVPVPFRLGLSVRGTEAKGWFFNGGDQVSSTRGTLEGDKLVLQFDQYAARLEGTFKGDAFDGVYTRATHDPGAVHAIPYAPPAASATPVPSIAGLWDILVKNANGDTAWRMILRQTGPEISGSILRIDGDTGALTGTFQNGKVILGHFSGARPVVFEVTPQADGTLAMIQNGSKQLRAYRTAEARAKHLPEPPDPFHFTSVQNESEPFRFSGSDLKGEKVSNADARFRGKVVVLAVGGSWCPNCHDEAPVLEALYEKYRRRGLEVVALSFEEADQLKDPTRLRAFIHEYGIRYTVLLAGEPEQLQAKLPQATNLTSWPTTFFIGRDGLIKGVHSGFAGKPTGEFHTTQNEEVTALVEGLLAEKR